MTTPNPTKFGTICHAGGAEILIEARYREWVDWANLALYSYSPMLSALRIAYIALGMDELTPAARRTAIDVIAAAIQKAESK